MVIDYTMFYVDKERVVLTVCNFKILLTNWVG
jgi:hypothetical protein